MFQHYLRLPESRRKSSKHFTQLPNINASHITKLNPNVKLFNEIMSRNRKKDPGKNSNLAPTIKIQIEQINCQRTTLFTTQAQRLYVCVSYWRFLCRLRGNNKKSFNRTPKSLP